MKKSLHSQEMVKLQEILVKLRKNKGIRQVDVAKKLGQPQSFVSKYESGERCLDILELRQVCFILDITLLEFIKQFEETI